MSWAGAQSTPRSSHGAGPSVSEIAVNFTNYQQITKSVVFVNPELAMLCRGASKEEVDAARIKFGPHANTGIVVYMNKLAGEAFSTNASVFPVGSVVVKQKTIHGYFDNESNERRRCLGSDPIRDSVARAGCVCRRNEGGCPGC